jgi:hypothetical protein
MTFIGMYQNIGCGDDIPKSKMMIGVCKILSSVSQSVGPKTVASVVRPANSHSVSDDHSQHSTTNSSVVHNEVESGEQHKRETCDVAYPSNLEDDA